MPRFSHAPSPAPSSSPSSGPSPPARRVPRATRRSQRHPLDYAALPDLSIEELRRLWSVHIGRTPPPAQRRLLVRELAWRVQAREHGGLDRSTRRALAAAVREAVRRQKAKPGGEAGPGAGTADAASRGDSPSRPPRRRPARNHAAATLAPATRLVRDWHGVRHEVEVVGVRRYRYRGAVYRSLSEVARAITDSHWSGPRFFGLVTRAGDAVRSDGARSGVNSTGPTP